MEHEENMLLKSVISSSPPESNISIIAPSSISFVPAQYQTATDQEECAAVVGNNGIQASIVTDENDLTVGKDDIPTDKLMCEVIEGRNELLDQQEVANNEEIVQNPSTNDTPVNNIAEDINIKKDVGSAFSRDVAVDGNVLCGIQLPEVQEPPKQDGQTHSRSSSWMSSSPSLSIPVNYIIPVLSTTNHEIAVKAIDSKSFDDDSCNSLENKQIAESSTGGSDSSSKLLVMKPESTSSSFTQSYKNNLGGKNHVPSLCYTHIILGEISGLLAAMKRATHRWSTHDVSTWLLEYIIDNFKPKF